VKLHIELELDDKDDLEVTTLWNVETSLELLEAVERFSGRVRDLTLVQHGDPHWCVDRWYSDPHVADQVAAQYKANGALEPLVVRNQFGQFAVLYGARTPFADWHDSVAP